MVQERRRRTITIIITITIIREEVEKLQARLNGRDPGELLDAIEAEGFEPEGWSYEVKALATFLVSNQIL